MNSTIAQKNVITYGSAIQKVDVICLQLQQNL